MTKNIAKLLLFTLYGGNPIFCQSNYFEGAWTDGSQIFYSLALSNKLLQFEGGTLHEGGAAFYGSFSSDTSLIILGNRMENKELAPSLGDLNWILKYKKVNNYETLLLTDTNHVIQNLLLKLPDSQSLEEYIITNKINYQLAGKYLLQGSMDTIIFYPNQKIVQWGKNKQTYEFESEYDFPINAVTFNKKTYWFEKFPNRLDFFAAKKVGNDYYEKGPFVFRLKLIERIFHFTVSLNGEYSLASLTPLTDDILDFYSLEELKLLRNEIYARHGYIFTSPALKKYFGTKAWYKPLFNDINEKLTELEKINIQLIRKKENELNNMK